MAGACHVQGEAGFVQPGEGKAAGELLLSSALRVVIQKAEPHCSCSHAANRNGSKWQKGKFLLGGRKKNFSIEWLNTRTEVRVQRYTEVLGDGYSKVQLELL